MYIDFSLALVVLTLVAGCIWLLDKFIFKPKRKLKATEAKPSWPIEYANSFFPVLALVLIVRSFVLEPFQIPSGSMLPTLQIGDFILVNKFSYGVRLPVTHNKILDTGAPENGDIAVFRYPLDTRANYIKRIIGLPGDKVEFVNNQLRLNGKPIKRVQAAEIPAAEPYQRQFQEELGAATYQVYNYPTPAYNFPEITVPEGYFLAMGDNRDQSNDSRFWCEEKANSSQGCISFPQYLNHQGQPLVLGLVAEEHLVGKAWVVWMHWPKFLSLPSFSSARVLQ